MAIKLEKGYYGSNVPTLGAYNYRGFDVIVDNGNMGMPVEGDSFLVGLYKAGDDSGQDVNTRDVEGFTLEKACQVVDEMIDWELGIKREVACTCGAKHTSNLGFHSDWCDKK